MIGGRRPACRIGGVALFGDGRLALGGRTARWSSVCRSPRPAGRPAAAPGRVGASGCGRSSITGGAKRTRCTECTRCACSIASRRSATSAVTSRKFAGCGAVSSAPRARPAAMCAAGHSRARRRHPQRALSGRQRRSRRRRLASRRTRSPGVGRSDDMAEPDQHHLRRSPPIGRGLHLADALQQHLPGPRQHRHRQPIRQRRAAGALRFRQVRAVAQRRDGFQPRDRVQQFQQVLQQRAEIGAALIGAVGDLQRLGAACRPSPPPSGRTPARGRPGPACR